MVEARSTVEGGGGIIGYAIGAKIHVNPSFPGRRRECLSPARLAQFKYFIIFLQGFSCASAAPYCSSCRCLLDTLILEGNQRPI